MSTHHWNPIRRNLTVSTNNRKFSALPVTFVPRMYARQCKRRLYNNLLIMLGGSWALTISNDMDIFETETRLKIKNILSAIVLLVGHLVAVPLIIGRLNLHYSIILGAMGMSLMPFFYYARNPVILSIVISLRCIFVALFDVSGTIYIVKLARSSSRIRGIGIYGEILVMRSFTMLFGCSANVVTTAWHRYARVPLTNDDSVEACGTNFCPVGSSRKFRLAGTLSNGQNTIFVAVMIVMALSGMIIIAVYLKPMVSLDDSDLSAEPSFTNPGRILKRFTVPRAKQLAILIISCVFMHVTNDEYALAYVTCSFSYEYGFFVGIMKEFWIMFGTMSCSTVVDFMGFHWLYGISLLAQLSSYFCLLLLNYSIFAMQLSYLIVYHVLCTSIGVEASILQLLVIQTLGYEEVSAWCFYYVIGDAVYLVRSISDDYTCTLVKLWISIVISTIAIISIATYSRGFDENYTCIIGLNERCSLSIETLRKILEKSANFDLKIVIEKPKYIRKVETFLVRKYTLKSQLLVPPADDVFYE